MFLDENGWKTSPRVGDEVLVHVSYGGRGVLTRVERKKKGDLRTTLKWRPGGQEEESFPGIMSPSEIERMLHILARAFGLDGIEKCELDPARTKMGWFAFRFV